MSARVTETVPTVPQIILSQLGGNRFAMMTGAKDFLADGNTLSFRLPGSGGFCKSGINKVTVTLDESDTYTVKFLKVRSGMSSVKVVTVSEFSDIYAEDLRELFTRETGLVTSF